MRECRTRREGPCCHFCSSEIPEDGESFVFACRYRCIEGVSCWCDSGDARASFSLDITQDQESTGAGCLGHLPSGANKIPRFRRCRGSRTHVSPLDSRVLLLLSCNGSVLTKWWESPGTREMRAGASGCRRSGCVC